MLLPVSSVNCSRVAKPGAESVTSADAWVSTLMNVLRSNAWPPHVPARLVCLLRIAIDGMTAAVGVETAGSGLPAVPTGAAHAAAAHSRGSRAGRLFRATTANFKQ